MALRDESDLSSLIDEYLPRTGRSSADNGHAARELVDMLKSTQARLWLCVRRCRRPVLVC